MREGLSFSHFFFFKPVYILVRETTVSLSLRGGETPKHSRKKRSVCFFLKKKTFFVREMESESDGRGRTYARIFAPLPPPHVQFYIAARGRNFPYDSCRPAGSAKQSYIICFK